MTTDRPAPVFNEVIHQPTRLAVVAFLSGCTDAEFRAVREHCGVSESALSKVVSTLEAASYVKVRRGFVGKRPRTWLRLTPQGRAALTDHLAVLQRIASEASALGAALEQQEQEQEHAEQG
ncbi:transcriptional regulator [Kitasatospora sp. GAS204B]|uniref:transcriptional regulator n=1 Tax=unclassified Kitasatospora TaxID=2633591 RepID=UPI00247721E3|nr:transcriptional regulator [Kitasatospora sp. GAS204B]MDH6121979.1 DNA-binding MarR family transcriptional regulator [Kitasatospora sp. GAS204B]